MADAPEVSVVMGVFNEADNLEATLDSVLSQTDVALEFIAVDDGSTDATPEILSRRAAADPRLRVLRQENAGLTAALIAGCAAAKGDLIARQDAGGDLSLPGRFAAQAALLRSNPEIVLTCVGVRYVGPEGEPLFETIIDGEELEERLWFSDPKAVEGVSHHGAVMMRRDAYGRLGGYRRAFPVSQDLDLWLRLAEIGRCVSDPTLLYVASLKPGRISQERRHDQAKAMARAVAAAAARRCGEPEPAETTAAPANDGATQAWLRWASNRQSDAEFFYFVGRLLTEQDTDRARVYFRRSVDAAPLFWRSRVRLAQLLVREWLKA